MCCSERALLNRLMIELYKLDSDVLVGHNISGFDLDVLLHRAQVGTLLQCFFLIKKNLSISMILILYGCLDGYKRNSGFFFFCIYCAKYDSRSRK